MKKFWLLLYSSFVALAAVSGDAAALPIPLFILGPIATFGASIGLSTAAITGVLTALPALINVGIAVGINFSANKFFAPKMPKPEERQAMARDGTHSRFRSYGRVKVGGVLAYVTKQNGSLYRVIVFGQGEIDAVEEYWIDEHAVPISAINASGNITAGKYAGAANLQHRLGTDNQSAYADLIAAVPSDWTASDKGNGMPHCLHRINPTSAAAAQDLYPRGEPNLRQLQRAAKVFDPRDLTQTRNPATWKWSENAALIILDYLTHKEGFRWPWSRVEPELASWIAAADICDQPVNLKGGGTVARYKIGHTYDLIERPGVVLQQYLNACDGEIFFGPAGGVGLRVGVWEEPTVVIDDDCIVDSQVQKGDGILERANIIRATYTSPDHDYQTQDAQEWRDEADIAKRGELPSPLALPAVPNHSQARRLEKIEADKRNPKYRGSVTCNIKGIKVRGNRFIILRDSENNIDTHARILIEPGPSLVMTEDGVLQGVRFSWASASKTAYDWNATLEEGDAPPVTSDIAVDNTVPAMTGLSVAVEQAVVANGQSVAIAAISWSPGNPSLLPRVEIKLTSGAGTTWTPIVVATDQHQTKSGVLIDGESYDVRGRFDNLGGKQGPFTSVVTFTATADTVAPPVVTSVVGTGGAGSVQLTWNSPNNVHYIKAKIYRHTVNTFSAATFIKDVFGPSNAPQSTSDTGLAPGTYHYWVKASNGSNITAAEVASGPVTVT